MSGLQRHTFLFSESVAARVLQIVTCLIAMLQQWTGINVRGPACLGCRPLPCCLRQMPVVQQLPYFPPSFPYLFAGHHVLREPAALILSR